MSWLVSLLILLAPVLPHDLRVSFTRRVAGLLRDRIACAGARSLGSLTACYDRLDSLAHDILIARTFVLAGLPDEFCIRPSPSRRASLSASMSAGRMVRRLSWLIGWLDRLDALAGEQLACIHRDIARIRAADAALTAAPARSLRASTRPARHDAHVRLLELSG